MGLKSWLEKRKEDQQTQKVAEELKNRQELKQREAAFHATPYDIDPITKGPDAGYYVKINKKIWAQAVIIGKQERSRIQPGFDEDFNIYAVDELIKVARIKHTSINYCKIKIPLEPEEEAVKLGDAIKKVSMTEEQERQGSLSTLNSEHNKHAKQELKAHTSTAFKGRDHYYHFAFLAAVIGRSKDDVDTVVHSIEANCKKAGIRFEIPVFNQVGLIKTALPTNYIAPKILQPATGKLVASMSPLRNPNPKFPDKGIIVCTNAETGKPIKIGPTKENNESSFILGPPGSGKTFFICEYAGRAIANGDRAIIMEPKSEDEGEEGTDYRNFCKEFNGELRRFGPGGINFNPLMVFFDKKIMGSRRWAYQKALNDHYDILEGYYTARIGDRFSERMAGKLIESLIEIYKERDIIDKEGNVINFENWDNPSLIRWPTEHELYLLWEKHYSKDKDPSYKALIANTAKARPGGPLWWIANCRDRFELENDLVVLDISQLADNIKSAMCVLIMGGLKTRYLPKPADGTKKRRTYFFVDELANIIGIPEVVPHLTRQQREGRASFITPVWGTQDTNIDEKFLNITKANTKNIFLMCNLDKQNIDPFLKTFKLGNEYRSKLQRKGYGMALYLKDKYVTDVRLPPTKREEEALSNGKHKEEEKVHQETTFELDKEVRWLRDEHGFFVEAWTEGIEDLNIPGFTHYRIRDCFINGTVNAWIETGLIEEAKEEGKQDKIGPEGYKHYSFVCQLAGEMSKMGYYEVQVNHNSDVDISAYLVDEGGNKVPVCIEVEMPGTHSPQKWKDKKKYVEGTFKEVIFTCPTEIKDDMIKALGKDYVFPRGGALKRKLEKLKVQYPGNLSQLSSVTEAQETLKNKC